MSKVSTIKTSRYDFSLPPARDSSKGGRNLLVTGEKECYYYYVYRKRIDPNEIKGPEDLPVPLIFRRNNVTLEKIGGSMDNLKAVGNKGTSLSPMKVSDKTKGITRSNSMPDVKKKKGSPLPRVTRNPKLKPIKNPPSASKPLPKITKTKHRNASPPSATVPEAGSFDKSGKSVASLLNLSPEDGLQWSRHTTLIKTPFGVTEKTINIETKKVKKDGKWVEEVVKTKTVTDPNGVVTKSRRKIARDMKKEEIANFENSINKSEQSRSRSPPQQNQQQSKPLTDRQTTNTNKSGKTQKPAPSTQPSTRSSSKKPVTPAKEELDNFSQEVLDATNACRNNHGVAPMQINKKLTKLALEWAERLAKTEKMEHGDKKDLGENIYCKTSSQPWFEMSGTEVVENWYQEVEDHNYDEEPRQGFLKTGHFTQLIWEDTKEMGVAFARNKNGHMAFVVAYFNPKGNWIGEFRKKVPRPGARKSSPKPPKERTSTKSRKEVIFKDRKSSPAEDKGSRRTKKLAPIEKKKPTKPVNKKTKKSSPAERIISPDRAFYKDDSALSSRNGRDSRLTPSTSNSPLTPNSAEYDSSNLYDSLNYSQTPSRDSSRSDIVSPSNSQLSTRSEYSAGYSDYQNQTNNTKKKAFSSPSPSPTPSLSHTYESLNTARESRDKNRLKSTSPEIDLDRTFIKDFLNAHNHFRGNHGVDPLKYSTELSEYAQEWANQLAKRDYMEHRDDNPYGENIYMKWSPDKNHKVPGEEPVESWYEEIKDYEFGQEPIDLGSCGHFTQVIWAETEMVGVGASKSASGKIFFVANYDPPGNYVGQFSRMVPSPLN